jgi:hypothetical protein
VGERAMDCEAHFSTARADYSHERVSIPSLSLY